MVLNCLFPNFFGPRKARKISPSLSSIQRLFDLSQSRPVIDRVFFPQLSDFALYAAEFRPSKTRSMIDALYRHFFSRLATHNADAIYNFYLCGKGLGNIADIIENF